MNLFGLRIHEIIKDKQNANGIRFADYAQYHQYCTRRVKRIRSMKNVRFTYGRGNTFTNKVMTPDMVKNKNFLEVLLMYAERSWAHALELKADLGNASSKNGRRQYLKRLVKASKWADDLHKLSSNVANTHTTLEAYAYSSYMRGLVFIEKQNFVEALKCMAAAHNVHERLGKIGSFPNQDLFGAISEEIEPSVRYCKYSLSKSNPNIDIESLVGIEPHIEEKLSECARTSMIHDPHQKLEWLGKSATVDFSQLALTLDLAVVQSKKFCKKVAKGKVLARSLKDPHYSPAFRQFKIALKMISDQHHILKKKENGPKVSKRRNELNLMVAFARYRMAQLMFLRNEQIADTVLKGGSHKVVSLDASDMVHIYNSILLSVKDMRECVKNAENLTHLPILHLEEDRILNKDDMDRDTEPEFVLEQLDAAESWFRACRCYYLSEFYAKQLQWGKAFSLLDSHVPKLCNEAMDRESDLISGHDNQDIYDGRMDKMKILARLIEGGRLRATASFYTENSKELPESSPNDSNTGYTETDSVEVEKGGYQSLLLRLFEFDDRINDNDFRIECIPPQLEIIPAKPILLDGAFNAYMDFPDLSEKVPKKIEESSSLGSAIPSFVRWALGRA